MCQTLFRERARGRLPAVAVSCNAARRSARSSSLAAGGAAATVPKAATIISHAVGWPSNVLDALLVSVVTLVKGFDTQEVRSSRLGGNCERHRIGGCMATGARMWGGQQSDVRPPGDA
eukprot:scaffold608892_cov130-Attheya_sp.AAC.1